MKKINTLKLSAALLVALCLPIQSTRALEHSSKAVNYSELFDYDKVMPLDAVEKLNGAQTTGINLKLTLSSVHDQKIPAILMVPKLAAGAKAPCVILMHGLGGNKEQMITILSGSLLAQGYAVYAMDAPYHGERLYKDDHPERTLQYPYRARDGFVQAVIDLRRSIDYLQSRKDINPDKIGYFGISMGSIIGSVLAGVDNRVKAPIFMVGGADWGIISSKSSLSLMPNTPEAKAGLAQLVHILAPVDPINWIGKISPRPVFMINGDKDIVVPIEANKKLHKAAKEPKKIYWYHGGHIPPFTEFIAIGSQISGWLNKYLKGDAISK